jgi:hypothetical protein
MTSAMELALPTVISLYPEISQRKLIRFQVRNTQFSAIRVCKLDFEKSVVTNEDNVIVRRRIKFVSGVFRDGGISTGMETR